MPLNPYEERIVKIMYMYGRPMTKTQIANKSGIGWATVSKYLKSLSNIKRRVVYSKKGRNKKTYWYLNY
jgi:response regulator of citrate/malate metabolism